jgi:8-oxo-dGTP diphosphatase
MQVSHHNETGVTLLLVSACALIDSENRVLLAQRPPGKPLEGLWEFPGGKIELGESPEQTVVREMMEELGIKVRAKDLAPIGFASHAYPKFHLLMPLYACRKWLGKISPREGQEIAWVKPLEMAAFPMPPADEPLIARLSAYTDGAYA